jgi:hypothetical protein
MTETLPHKKDDQDFIDKHGRNHTCECGLTNIWSPRFDMWMCSGNLAKYKALYKNSLEV